MTTSGGEEILLGIVPVANGTAVKTHEAILNLLHQNEISFDKISACVFDTTSVNTGEVNGIIRKLERSFEHPILELACRHHMYELVCGAASEIIIGKTQQGKGNKKTTAPYEPLFRNLCESWENIDKENLTIFDIKSLPRALSTHIDEAKEFLKEWISTKNSQREDYLQMAKLCLIYIGGDLPNEMAKFRMQKPGAYHHARWMSKVLYVLKLAMLQPPFVDNIQNIRSLALFYSVFYAKQWLSCILPSEAPSQDLSLFKALEKVSNTKGNWPIEFQRICEAAMMKLKCHTWYLSERLVALALFSDKTKDTVKEKMRLAIIRHNKKPSHSEQQQPQCSSFTNKNLWDFVGPDTYTFFKLLNLNPNLLNENVSKWSSSAYFKHHIDVIRNLSVVNDISERALGMATYLHGQTMPKNEIDLQAQFIVVDELRKIHGKFQKTKKSKERVSRESLEEFLKSCLINK